MWKFTLFVLLGIACVSQASDDESVVIASASQTNNQEFTPEDECSRAGGICIPKHECPQDMLTENGECPKQKSLGAVCCSSHPISETRCQKLGGICLDSCRETTVIAKANDCPVGKVCCPLVE